MALFLDEKLSDKSMVDLESTSDITALKKYRRIHSFTFCIYEMVICLTLGVGSSLKSSKLTSRTNESNVFVLTFT